MFYNDKFKVRQIVIDFKLPTCSTWLIALSFLKSPMESWILCGIHLMKEKSIVHGKLCIYEDTYYVVHFHIL